MARNSKNFQRSLNLRHCKFIKFKKLKSLMTKTVGKAGYDIIIFSFCYTYNLVNCRKFIQRIFISRLKFSPSRTKYEFIYLKRMLLFCIFSNNIKKFIKKS